MPVQMTSEGARTVKNVDVFKEEFKRYANAAVGITMIRTREPQRCANAIQLVAIAREASYKLWVCNKGWQTFPLPRPGDEGNIDIHRPMGPPDLETVDLAKAFKSIIDRSPAASDRGAYYVMYYPHPHFEKPIIWQYIKDFAQKAREEEIRPVMLVPDEAKLPTEIEDDVHITDFAPPSHAELLACYEEFVASLDESFAPKFEDDEITEIIQNGLGMTYSEFETAIALAVVTHQNKKDEDGNLILPTAKDYTKLILTHKTEIIKKTDLLELMPSESMSSVGGFDRMKHWFKQRATAYSQESRDYGISIPRGMLAVGPPGSGKSLFGKAVANEFATPLVKLDIGKLFGKFVGESEGRMRSALKIVEAMAPCVLLVDEIDKGFGGLSGGGTDGGTSMRVLGSFLTWMQDRDIDKFPVFIVMTANNVIGLPPELMRRGRIDEIFACSFPGHDERVEILNIHLTKRGHKLSKSDLNKIAAECDKYVGAELESAVADSLYTAFEQKLKHPTPEIVIQHIKEITPLSKAFADKINVMHEWAKNNAKPASSTMNFDTPAVAGKPAVRKVTLPPRGPVKPSTKLDG